MTGSVNADELLSYTPNVSIKVTKIEVKSSILRNNYLYKQNQQQCQWYFSIFLLIGALFVITAIAAISIITSSFFFSHISPSSCCHGENKSIFIPNNKFSHIFLNYPFQFLTDKNNWNITVALLKQKISNNNRNLNNRQLMQQEGGRNNRKDGRVDVQILTGNSNKNNHNKQQINKHIKSIKSDERNRSKSKDQEDMITSKSTSNRGKSININSNKSNNIFNLNQNNNSSMLNIPIRADALIRKKRAIEKDKEELEIIHLSGPLIDLIKELFDMAKEDPDRFLDALNISDPLHTQIQNLTDFRCPEVRLPIHINTTTVKAFKQKAKGTYLFFQHIRKAGGTSFCDLARQNEGNKSTPQYFCMIDEKGSLATPPWSRTNYLHSKIQNFSYRIVSNEYDVFYKSFLTERQSQSLYVTSLRDPIERWYSQYRFEHIEHRDERNLSLPNVNKTFIEWYDSILPWNLGINYYVKTFYGEHIGKYPIMINKIKHIFANESYYVKRQCKKYWTYRAFERKYSFISWNIFQRAIYNLSNFSLVLILEYIQSIESLDLIKRILGWKKSIRQILPHEQQAIRTSKRSESVFTALTDDEYKYVAKQNVFDILFYQVARRMFLERIGCRNREDYIVE